MSSFHSVYLNALVLSEMTRRLNKRFPTEGTRPPKPGWVWDVGEKDIETLAKDLEQLTREAAQIPDLEPAPVGGVELIGWLRRHAFQSCDKELERDHRVHVAYFPLILWSEMLAHRRERLFIPASGKFVTALVIPNVSLWSYRGSDAQMMEVQAVGFNDQPITIWFSLLDSGKEQLLMSQSVHKERFVPMGTTQQFIIPEWMIRFALSRIEELPRIVELKRAFVGHPTGFIGMNPVQSVSLLMDAIGVNQTGVYVPVVDDHPEQVVFDRSFCVWATAPGFSWPLWQATITPEDFRSPQFP